MLFLSFECRQAAGPAERLIEQHHQGKWDYRRVRGGHSCGASVRIDIIIIMMIIIQSKYDERTFRGRCVVLMLFVARLGEEEGRQLS